MLKQFPKDCERDCPHFTTWDMSIDDWTCYCDLLKVQIDECDGFDGLHLLPLCPRKTDFQKEDTRYDS